MQLDLNYRNRNGLWRVGTEYFSRGRRGEGEERARDKKGVSQGAREEEKK